MAEDFETAWEQYMKAYDSCNPEIYYQMLQLEEMCIRDRITAMLDGFA